MNMKLLTHISLVSLLVLTHAVQADNKTGKQVYDQWCEQCHMMSPFAPGTIQLRQTRGEDLSLIEERRKFPEEYIRLLVRQGVGGMPSFRLTEITEAELQQLTLYMSGMD
jgi:mono/diheme cytochrome c family protein